MTSDRDTEMAELIRALAKCRRMADFLGLGFLSDLLAACQFEAALNWDGGHKGLADPDQRLEQLLHLKIRLALADDDTNIVAMPRREE